jgi:hypothetical protein
MLNDKRSIQRVVWDQQAEIDALKAEVTRLMDLAIHRGNQLVLAENREENLRSILRTTQDALAKAQGRS